MTVLESRQAPMSLEDFRGILQAYQQATEQLKDSHDRLMNEVARLRVELARKNQQLERRKRLAALGEMAAGVAHEIRNPLGSIQLNTDLLARRLAPGSREAGLAEKIGKAVRGLDAIVNDMLTFTRVIEAERAPTRLADLLAEAAAEIAPRLDEAGVTLDADGLTPELEIPLDGRLFKRVLSNLMLNSVDAMAGAGGGRLRVQAERLGPEDDDAFRIVISDTGPGIAPEAIRGQKLFNPFFTTKQSGIGLGLAIVHHILEAHGGSITAANRPGGGAAFTILVPALSAEGQGDPAGSRES